MTPPVGEPLLVFLSELETDSRFISSPVRRRMAQQAFRRRPHRGRRADATQRVSVPVVSGGARLRRRFRPHLRRFGRQRTVGRYGGPLCHRVSVGNFLFLLFSGASKFPVADEGGNEIASQMKNEMKTRRYGASNLRVVGGEHSLAVMSGLEQFRQVRTVLVNSEYDDGLFDNDIALLQLVEPFDFSTGKVAPLAVVGQGQEIDAGTNATVSGWGVLTVSGTMEKKPDLVTLL